MPSGEKKGEPDHQVGTSLKESLDALRSLAALKEFVGSFYFHPNAHSRDCVLLKRSFAALFIF
jgi:hypothetical protein